MNTEVTGKSPRLLSLDVLRGATIATMILVNDPGDWDHIYPPLEHSVWNGCTPTDLVFPFFLFMAGVSVVYAMETRKANKEDHGRLIGHAFQRMITLLLINYGLEFIFSVIGNYRATNNFDILHTLGHMRLPGVLPRIAIVYFISTVLYLKTSAKTRVWIFAGVLIGYYIIMSFIPVPGVGYANLEPATNLGAWLDRLVFGTNHLWNQSHTWDPEGILGTIPAIGTGLFGVRVGSWLKAKGMDDGKKVTWMFVYGVGAVLLALVWDLFFPINKQLWTSSFVLYTGGLGTITLAMLYWLIDVQGYKKATSFFVAFGTNAITAYILAGVVPALIGYIPVHFNGRIVDPLNYIFLTVFAPNFSPVNASLLGAILLVLIIWVIMWVLYKRKIIIKV
jgi:predicted acyltransferase